MNSERLSRLRTLESNYEIKSDGVVVRKETNRRLSPYFDRGGYCTVRLSRQSKVYQYKVHELVAYKAGMDILNKTINHIDGNKKNNEPLNLEAITLQENIKHASFMKLNARGERQTSSKLTQEQVNEIREMYFSGNYLMREIAKIFNVARSNVSHIVSGRSWADSILSQYRKGEDTHENK